MPAAPTQRGRPQQTTQLDDPATSRAVDDLKRQLADVTSNPLVQRSVSVVKATVLAIGVNTIVHGLGRLPSGWLVTRSVNGAALLWEVSSDETTIVLNASAIATIDLQVW